MENIPCFIINLEKDKQKRQQMNKVCEKNGFTPTFVKAVYGKELSPDYVKTIVNQDMAKKHLGRELAPGEIGIVLSQLYIYKKMLDEHIEVALILEDDVDFSFTPTELTNLIAQLPKEWECVLMGHHTSRSREIDTLPSVWKQKKILEDHKLIRFAEKPVGAYGYLINLNGAKKMLNDYMTISRPIDHWDENKVNIYGMIPSLILVDERFLNDSLLSKERKKLKIVRTPYQSFKDLVQSVLKKLKLLEIYFTVKGFFLQLKVPREYEKNG